ncbi:MAG: PD-(D/E)XK nuclease family protein [Dysgonamonadaceae bacterium]|jgi:hypothetical protein|nr:PD-(D/E)XK nuclease family protein [Dysgonamonadaceae bacterium]
MSDTFLGSVAQDLVARFGTDLSDITIVFPNVRASLFFNNHLYRCAQAPLWAPQYISIESLFEKLSPFKKGDNIQLISELYETYQQVYNACSSTPLSETPDEFFFFGEILLNDFDDIDKNLVNPNALFTNLKELDDLKDHFSHLSEEQLQALIRHFKHAFQGESVLKTAFWSIWNMLGEIYFSFKERLTREKTAYTGMLMRSVIEDGQTELSGKHFAFVGFNVLSKCEQQLFKRLKKVSSFYWDYDPYYLNTEAGRFIKNNMTQFGSATDTNRESSAESSFASDKKITIIASPSESNQTAIISPWIDSLGKSSQFIHPDSAIVLCNEALLPTVMHAVPYEKVDNVNITMGFPITLTTISSFIQVLTEMQIKAYNATNQSFWYKYVLPVLRHPYTSVIFPEAGQIEKNLTKTNLFYPTLNELKDTQLFSYAETTSDLAHYLLEIIRRIGYDYEKIISKEDIYNGLYQESIFRSYQVINRLYGLLSTGKLKIEKTTFLRLLRKVLSTVQIPFHGEPVKGLQIMGVLETRTLDFKNVLMLNVNEGFMPADTSDNTFIPQFLRVYFEMSTVDHRDSIYAYYFYRLMQRAENITLVYNTDKTATGKSEMSRFLLQLLADTDLKDKIKRYSLYSPIKPRKPDPITIAKTESIFKALQFKYNQNINPEAQSLSPTALNTYIDCSYKFYLEYIKGIRNKDELADELDNSVFGSIFHQAAENLYREIGRIGNEGNDFQPFVVKKEYYDPYIKYPRQIEKTVLKAFEKVYFKERKANEKSFNGELLINFHVVCKMIERLIRFDTRRTPFTVHGLEYPLKGVFLPDNKNSRIQIGGIIDRLEEKDNRYYILDYKTGGRMKEYKSLEDLFAAKNNRAAHILQTFVYASLLTDDARFDWPVVPSLLYMQQASKEDYSPVISYNKNPIDDFKALNVEFKSLLLSKLDEIFYSDTPFQQTTVTSTCEYCNFRDMCNR